MADDTIDSLPKLLSRLPGLEVLRMRYCQLGRLECMHGHDSYGRTLYLYASFLDLDGPAIDRLTSARTDTLRTRYEDPVLSWYLGYR